MNLSVIPPMAEFLIQSGVQGFYCCGSTGEGVSLTTAERMTVAEAWVTAARQRVPVIVQVGHNSLWEAAELTSHAAQVGASAVSATCPSYFKVDTLSCLIDCMGQIASAGSTVPFYYYHIPMLTGNRLSMPDFLTQAGAAIPNLVGMKYTATELHEFLDCLSLEDGRFEMIWGIDEMLLAALSMGAKAAIGSTYNIAAPCCVEIINAFQQGDLAKARSLQLQHIDLVKRLKAYPYLAALKHLLSWQGLPLGGCRLPNIDLAANQSVALESALNLHPCLRHLQKVATR